MFRNLVVVKDPILENVNTAVTFSPDGSRMAFVRSNNAVDPADLVNRASGWLLQRDCINLRFSLLPYYPTFVLSFLLTTKQTRYTFPAISPVFRKMILPSQFI